jgi:hypothetical protein
MDDYKEKLRIYIERSIHDVCPYEDKNLQLIYHIGFLQGFLVRMMLRDSKVVDLFKRVIEDNKSGSKK